MKEFLTSSSLSSKLQAKHDLLQDAIQKGIPDLTRDVSTGVYFRPQSPGNALSRLFLRFLPAEAVNSDPSR